MPCFASSRSLAALHLSAQPTSKGIICVSVGMTGNPAALSADFVWATRSWWRSRSQFDVFRFESRRLQPHKSPVEER